MTLTSSPSPVPTTPSAPAVAATPTDQTFAYHVLMHSRRYGTCAFACASAEEAATTLSWLALRAVEQQSRDDVQRFFCLVPPDVATNQEQQSSEAAIPIPDTPEGEDALVICLHGGTLSWIAGGDLAERPVVVLETVNGEKETDGPFVCWQAEARPLATLTHLHRHAANRYLLLRRLDRKQQERVGGAAIPTEEAATPKTTVLPESDPLVHAWQNRNEQFTTAEETERPVLTLHTVAETHEVSASTSLRLSEEADEATTEPGRKEA